MIKFKTRTTDLIRIGTIKTPHLENRDKKHLPWFLQGLFHLSFGGSGWLQMGCFLNLFALRLLFVFVGSSIFSGCLGVTMEESPNSFFTDKAIRLEKQAQKDIQSNTFDAAIENYIQSQRIYALLDDREGRLRTSLALTGIYYLRKETEKSRQTAHQTLKIAQSLPGQPEFFRIYLMLGKIDNSQEHFQQSFKHAKTVLEKAIALIYLNRVEEAWQQVQDATAQTNFGDYAFVWYEYGKQFNVATAVEQSLTLYKKADDFLGISNALYLLGKIYHAHGDDTKARDYFERALVVNQALEHPNRIRSVLNVLRAIKDSETSEQPK